MKIALLSDIHGNLPALLQVIEHIEKWQPDHVIVNGDVVNRGTLSLKCWRHVAEKENWKIISGNHEHYVAEYHSKKRPKALKIPMSYWTYTQMGDRAGELLDLPDSYEIKASDGTTLKCYHGSVLGKESGISSSSPEETVLKRIDGGADVFCVGHTHAPFVRKVGGTLVVNSGAVGSPLGGDVRASYGQVIWKNKHWSANIIRLNYDRKEAENIFLSSGFISDVGFTARLVYHEWRTARKVLDPYNKIYREKVKIGMISQDQALQQILESIEGNRKARIF